ncbi:DUF2752 domain-containing protein [Pedobacter polaris]|uniref:DUF2752 domain-containing protein n=1 Tax=Pedobacter polaris TaxID=2571273 RepID=A0A4U1CVW8_9SPHI|nr:DUF2752 domain-containing protein [Pedobacter polaris]
MQVITIYILSALSYILGKADIFLIPCPFKYLTHLDCPGCGFQRSVLALFQGNFLESFQLYPPAIPFLLSAIAGISVSILKKNTESKLLKIMYFTTGAIVVINYVYKIATHQLH